MKTFSMGVSPVFTPFLAILGLFPGVPKATLNDERLDVRFGLSRFSLDISDIERAEVVSWNLLRGLGVRFGPSSVAFVGSLDNAVVLHLKQRKRVRALPLISVGVNRVTLGVEDARAFQAALRDEMR